MRQEKNVPAPATGTAAGIRAGEEVAEQTGSGGETKHDSASVWTQLLLAYGVHKSLIFFRVPLTAAVTPKIVKWLRARGWKIGKPKPQAPNASAN
ncbi:hypothetical protein LTR08_006789 [Meristemomyces frigidus]|nr:hypothetical protein LTR08_006789 [Meristemomyces frigidus]